MVRSCVQQIALLNDVASWQMVQRSCVQQTALLNDVALWQMVQGVVHD
jgi:hypothetical protein